MRSEVLLILTMVSILIEGLFSCGELSYISYPKYLLKKTRSRIFDRAYHNPESILTASLIGTNIFMTLATVLFSTFAIRANIHNPDVFSAILIIPIIFLFGEAGPKLIGRYKAKTIAPLFVPFLWGTSFLFYPCAILVDILRKGFQKIVFAGKSEMYSRNVVAKMLSSSYFLKVGRVEIEGLKNLLEISEKKVRDIMIPLSRVVMIEKSFLKERLMEYVKKYGYSRYPIYEGRVDNILGVVNIYDYLRTGEVKVIPPVYIPGSAGVMSVLNNYREYGEEMMVVVDEYGGCVGIVTLKDFWSMFVREIGDDLMKDEEWIKYDDSTHTTILDGGTRLEVVERMLGIKFHAEDVRTLSGFITQSMGRIPMEGEVFEYHGIRFIISKTSPKKIEEVKIEIP